MLPRLATGAAAGRCAAVMAVGASGAGAGWTQQPWRSCAGDRGSAWRRLALSGDPHPAHRQPVRWWL